LVGRAGIVTIEAVLDVLDNFLGLVLARSESLLSLLPKPLGLVLQLIQKPML
jgi:hypothetical protein